MILPEPFPMGRQATTPQPQYKHESNASNLLAIHGTFCGAAILSVILRLYVRIFMLKSLGTDDYIIVAAAVSPFVLPHISLLETATLPSHTHLIRPK
jgi:hypothetical protein